MTVYDSWLCSRWLVDRTYVFVAQAAQLLDSTPVSALAANLLEISRVRPLKGGSRTVDRVWDMMTSSKRSKDRMIEISMVLLDSENKSNTIATFHIDNFHLPKGHCADQDSLGARFGEDIAEKPFIFLAFQRSLCCLEYLHSLSDAPSLGIAQAPEYL